MWNKRGYDIPWIRPVNIYLYTNIARALSLLVSHALPTSLARSLARYKLVTPSLYTIKSITVDIFDTGFLYI